MMNRKEAYEFIESHVLEGIYNHAGNNEQMKAGHKRMKEAFKILNITKKLK